MASTIDLISGKAVMDRVQQDKAARDEYKRQQTVDRVTGTEQLRRIDQERQLQQARLTENRQEIIELSERARAVRQGTPIIESTAGVTNRDIIRLRDSQMRQVAVEVNNRQIKEENARIDKLMSSAEYTEENRNVEFSNITEAQANDIREIQEQQRKRGNTQVYESLQRQKQKAIEAEAYLLNREQDYLNDNKVKYATNEYRQREQQQKANIDRFREFTGNARVKEETGLKTRFKNNIRDWNTAVINNNFNSKQIDLSNKLRNKIIPYAPLPQKVKDTIQYKPVTSGLYVTSTAGVVAGGYILGGAAGLATTAKAGAKGYITVKGIQTGVEKGLYYTAPEEQKAIMQRDDFEEAQRYAYVLEEQTLREKSPIKAGVANWAEFTGIRNVKGFNDKEAFEKGIRDYYKDKGLTESQINNAVKIANTQRLGSNLAAPAALISIEATSELTGRTLVSNLARTKTTTFGYNSAGKTFGKAFINSAPSLAQAGFIEGALGYEYSRSSRKQEFEYSRFLRSGLQGSLIASTVGGVIVGGKAASVSKPGTKAGTLGKATEFGANVADLAEKPGDYFADIIQRTGAKVSKKPYYSPVFAPTSTNSFTLSTVPSITTSTSSVAPTATSVSINTETPTVQNTNQGAAFSYNYNTNFESMFETNTNINSNIQTNNPVNTPTSTTSFSPAFTASNNFVPVNTNINTPSNNPSTTAVNVPITIPDKFFPFPNVGFFGGTKGRKRGKKSRIKTRYSASFDAIALGIFSNKKPTKQYYSGNETRPIIIK
jgi:hypothetical protein